MAGSRLILLSSTCILCFFLLLSFPGSASAGSTCKAKVNFLGLRNVDVSLYDNSDPANPSLVSTAENKRNNAVFRLNHNTNYYVVIQQKNSNAAASAATVIATRQEDISCRANNNGNKVRNVRIHSLVCSLTARFTGIKAKVDVQGPNSGAILTYTNKRNNKHVNLLRNTGYTLSVSDQRTVDAGDPVTITRDFDCDERRHIEQDFTARARIHTWMQKDFTFEAFKEGTGGTVYERSVTKTTNRVQFYILRGYYDAKLTRFGNTLQSTLNCTTSDTCKWTGTTARLVVRFPDSRNVNVVVKDGTGATQYSWTNARNKVVRHVFRGSYEVSVDAPGAVDKVQNVDCFSNSQCRMTDFMSRLNVRFFKVKLDKAQLLIGSDVVAESKANIRTKWRPSALRHQNYTLRLIKGNHVVDRVVSCPQYHCKVTGFVTKVKVHFNKIGQANVQVTNGLGDTLLDVNRRHGIHFWALKQELTTTVSAGGVSVAKTVDCAVADCKFNQYTTNLSTRYWGLKRVTVEVHNPSAPAPNTLVISRTRNHSMNFKVLRHTYDIVYKWKGLTKTVAGVDCTVGNHCRQERVSSKMVARYHGLKRVQSVVSSGGSEVFSSTRKNYMAKWVLQGVYDVSLTKYNVSQVHTGVDCTGMQRCVIGNTTAVIVARFPGIRRASVTVTNGGNSVHYRANRNHYYRLRVLRADDYKVKVEKFASSYTSDSIDLSSTKRVVVKGFVARVVARFRGQRNVAVELQVPGADDQDYSQGQMVHVARNRRHRYRFRAICGDYSLYLNQEYYGSVTIPCPSSAGPAQDAADQMPVILPVTPPPSPVPSIEFTGIADVENLAILAVHDTAADHQLYRAANVTENYLLSADTDAGTWSRNLTQGNVMVSDSFTTTSGVAYTEDISGFFAALTVTAGTSLGESLSFEVFDPDQVDDEDGDGEIVSQEIEDTSVQDSAVVKVLKGTWSVTIYDGESNYTVTNVDCSGSTCAVGPSDFVCDITVEHAGLNVTRIALSNDDEDAIGVEGSDGDETVFSSLRGDYTLIIDNNAAQYTAAFSCDSATATVSGITTALTINFDGVSDVDTGIEMDDEYVASGESAMDKSEFTLLALPEAYDIDVSALGVSTTGSQVCSGASCVVERGVVMAINATDLSNVRAIIHAKAPEGDGQQEAAEEIFDSHVSVSLLRAVYDVVLLWDQDTSGTVTATHTLDCNVASCSLTDVTSTIHTGLAGLEGVDVEVQAASSGDTLVSSTDVDGEATHSVLKADDDLYQVMVSWKGVNHTSSVINANSPVSHNMSCELNILFPGRQLVDIVVLDTESQKIIYSEGRMNDSAIVTVLCGRLYDVDLSGTGYPYGQIRPDVLAVEPSVDVDPLQDPEMKALEALWRSCNGAAWSRDNDAMWGTVGAGGERVFSQDGDPVCLTQDKDLDEAPFKGILCRTGVVKEIVLEWNNVVCDKLPEDLVLLEFLQVLNLQGNSVDNVNDNFDEFQNIKALNLAYNGMTGTIPDYTHLSMSLQLLDLSNNGFTGAMPDSLNNLVFLKYLHLEHNKLSGEMPNLLNCTEILELTLNDNSLSGDLPSCFDYMQHMKKLWLQDNLFTGPIPAALLEWVHIIIVDLSNNNFSGGIGNLELLTTLSSLKTDGNPEMTEEAHCTTSDDGSQECSTANVSDSEGAAGTVSPVLSTVCVAMLASIVGAVVM